jgi:hypothetical protein
MCSQGRHRQHSIASFQLSKKTSGVHNFVIVCHSGLPLAASAFRQLFGSSASDHTAFLSWDVLSLSYNSIDVAIFCCGFLFVQGDGHVFFGQRIITEVFERML